MGDECIREKLRIGTNLGAAASDRETLYYLWTRVLTASTDTKYGRFLLAGKRQLYGISARTPRQRFSCSIWYYSNPPI